MIVLEVEMLVFGSKEKLEARRNRTVKYPEGIIRDWFKLVVYSWLNRAATKDIE